MACTGFRSRTAILPNSTIHMDMGLLGRIAGMPFCVPLVPPPLLPNPVAQQSWSKSTGEDLGLGPDLPTIMLLTKVG